MVNYIEGTINSIKNKEIRNATKTVFEIINDKEYTINDSEVEMEQIRIAYGESVFCKKDVLWFLLEMAQSENINKHKVKIDFERYHLFLSTLSKHIGEAEKEGIYKILVIFDKGAKDYLKNPDYYEKINREKRVLIVPYKPRVLSINDKKFPKRFENALETILEAERIVFPKPL